MVDEAERLRFEFPKLAVGPLSKSFVANHTPQKVLMLGPRIKCDVYGSLDSGAMVWKTFG
jgi:hypothetical protein